jgi:hypothetical protein
MINYNKLKVGYSWHFSYVISLNLRPMGFGKFVFADTDGCSLNMFNGLYKHFHET